MSYLPLRPSNEDDIIERLSVEHKSMKNNYNGNEASTTTAEASTPTQANTTLGTIVLIDISCDKKWICYLHYSVDNKNNKNVEITRERFKALDISENTETSKCTETFIAVDTPEDEVSVTISRSEPSEPFDLNTHYKSIKNFNKFLSISPCGNYIALSCHEETDKEKKKSSCIIFEMQNNTAIYYTSIKRCNGRAVFLDREKKEICLAVINSEKLVIYSDFSKSESPTYFYDLAPFGSSAKMLRENIAYQESFILENASWAQINNMDTAKKLMTLSRHIRYDVLVTPFVKGGIVRLWSIKDDGIRLTSFSAPDEHIVALSKNLKYAATITGGIRAVKVYNIKNGLLVYTLQSRFKDDKSLLEVTHARFCYESRYLVLSGLQKKYNEKNECTKTEVVFEVWYIEAEKSIYGKILDAGKECDYETKTIKPFVHRSLTDDKKKCLKGVYTSISEQDGNQVYSLELKIDEKIKSNSEVSVEWLDHCADNEPYKKDHYEIGNDINDNRRLKCAHINVEDKKFYIRFGNRMIQLWILGNSNASIEERKEDRLVYIRAYKGPSYGLAYSFRDTWEIEDFDSIKFIEGTPVGRIILNIKQDEKDLKDDEEKEELKGVYHTEEIFLPLINDHHENKKFDYHTFESACQALHYLNWRWEKEQYKNDISSWNQAKDAIEKVKFKFELRNCDTNDMEKELTKYEKNEKYKKNLHNLFEKTYNLIKKAVVESNYENSNYFATMAGSRTLAMLASFPQGREIIKLLLKSKDSIFFSIFSYSRSIKDITTAISESDDADKKVYLKRSATSKNDTMNNGIKYRSSPKINEVIIGKFSKIAENENVLTVLIKELSYNLYKLMFNRILSDSKKIGPGCLSALADALLFLQEEGNTDLLLSSSQKLSYLAIDKYTLGILESEMGEVLKVKDLQREYVSNIRNLECHSTMEQIQKYKLSIFKIHYHLYYKLHIYLTYKATKKSLWVVLKNIWSKYIAKPIARFFNMSRKDGSKNRTQICVVPLPYFNTYNILLEDRTKSNDESYKNEKGLIQHFLPAFIIKCVDKSRGYDIYKETSAFVAIASNQNSINIFRQGDTVLEVMLQYKWRKFLRLRFIGVCLIHAAYYITYCTGVQFALEMYGYKSEEEDRSLSKGHLASIICMSISGSALLIQEIRQVIKSRRLMDYLRSGYNWVDIVAFILPLVTLLQLINNWNNFYETCSIAALILWLHAIVRLRVISFVGIALEIIIQLSQKVWSILFILLLVVFAFTHSFIVLLRQREDTYFQDNFNGTTSMPTNGTLVDGPIPTIVGNTTLYNISSDNGFSNPFKAFYQVWLLIFGVWDPVVNGEAGDDKMVFILCMLFAFITVLIFTNMVIALMSSTVDEVKNKGNKVWVSHFASVLAEIEQLWCFPSTRRNRNNNPMYIYYIANYDSVQKQEEKLKEETNELKKKVLDIDHNGIKICSSITNK